MASRVSRNPATLRDQMTTAIAGITAAGASWPAAAPSAATVTALRDDLAAAITDTDAKEAAWKVAAQAKAGFVNDGIAIMNQISETVDVLYGVGAAQAANFGLAPKGAPIEPLHKLIEIELRDGPVPGSLFFDWENIEGASYEVQWSTASTFATIVGSSTTSGASEYVIGGLTPGTQYWARVRPHRGSDTAEWSDPATRVAPI